jgi:hypothetical protein
MGSRRKGTHFINKRESTTRILITQITIVNLSEVEVVLEASPSMPMSNLEVEEGVVEVEDIPNIKTETMRIPAKTSLNKGD